MATRSRFFDSVGGDRIYTSDAWAQIIAAISSDGYIPGRGQNMVVTETPPPTMGVAVGLGSAVVQGRYFEVYTTYEVVPLAAANPSSPRIDRVVVRLDLSSGVRDVKLAALTGTPAATPIPPALTRNATIWEISLAQVRVNAGATSVSNANITSERDNATVCGMAVPPGLVVHNHNGADNGGANVKAYKDHIETFDMDSVVKAEDVQFYIPRAPTLVTMTLRGRAMLPGLLPAHDHAGTVASAEDTLHAHAFTTGDESDNHAHPFTSAGSSANHSHVISAAPPHTHSLTRVPINGEVGLQTGAGTTTSNPGSYISSDGGHDHGGATLGQNVDHTHTGTTDGRNTAHHHAGVTNTESAAHKHIITMAGQGVSGHLTNRRPEGVNVVMNGTNLTALWGGVGIGANVDWDVQDIDVTPWCHSGWNRLDFWAGGGGRLKVHMRMEF